MIRKGFAIFACSFAITTAGYALEPELVSVKHSGLGGAGVAYPQDGLSIVLNPASSAQLCNRFDVGIHWKRLDSRFNITDTTLTPFSTNVVKNHDRNIVHPDLAFNYWLGSDLSVGLAFHNSFYARFEANQPVLDLGSQKLQQKLMVETITPVLAWRFCDCHTIGIALPLYVNGYKNGGLEAIDISRDPTHLTDRDWDYATGWGINVGCLLEIMPSLDFGLFYQPKVSMKRHYRYQGFIPGSGKIDIPETLRAGFVFKDDCFDIAFDLEHRSYSDLGFWGNPFRQNSDSLGSDSGAGLGWSNQTLFRLGADYSWTPRLLLRAGVEQSTTHVPDDDALFGGIFGKAITTTVSVGCTYLLDCNQELSAYYAHGFKRKVKGGNDLYDTLLNGEGVTREFGFDESADYFAVSFGMSF